MSIIDLLIRQLAPYDCLDCGIEGSLLCPRCRGNLPAALSYPHPKIHVRTVQAVTPYQGAAKNLLWKLKSAGAQEAAKIMAEQMLDYIPQKISNLVIVPIPTATSRVRQRGYDQAKLLARCLARQARLPYVDCLTRLGQTHQVGATRNQRMLQNRSAFRIRHPEILKKTHIILVDDVITTGATIEAAAAVLLASGVMQIDVLAFAQAKLRAAT